MDPAKTTAPAPSATLSIGGEDHHVSFDLTTLERIEVECNLGMFGIYERVRQSFPMAEDGGSAVSDGAVRDASARFQVFFAAKFVGACAGIPSAEVLKRVKRPAQELPPLFYAAALPYMRAVMQLNGVEEEGGAEGKALATPEEPGGSGGPGPASSSGSGPTSSNG